MHMNDDSWDTGSEGRADLAWCETGQHVQTHT